MKERKCKEFWEKFVQQGPLVLDVDSAQGNLLYTKKIHLDKESVLILVKKTRMSMNDFCISRLIFTTLWFLKMTWFLPRVISFLKIVNILKIKDLFFLLLKKKDKIK